MISIIELITGIFIVVVTLHEIFHSVVVPRWSPRKYRLAPILFGALFWPLWKLVANNIKSSKLREFLLGAYAPTAMFLLLILWISALAVGFGFILLGCGPGTNPPLHNLAEAIYFASASLFTMGFGNIVAINTISHAVVLAAAFSGVAVMAMIISLLFTLYSSVQSREITVNLIQLQAGKPPSGLQLLLSCADLKLTEELPAMFSNWSAWISAILETHRAYLVLNFFRSSETGISWVSSLHAILDAATIVITSTEDIPKGHAKLLYKIGVKTASQLTHVFALKSDSSNSLSRQAFDDGLKLLTEAGYHTNQDPLAYDSFLSMRSGYAPLLESIVEHLAHVPAYW